MITKWMMALAAAPILLAQPQARSIEKAVLEVSAQMTRRDRIAMPTGCSATCWITTAVR